ncbi:hypothetical protein Tco_0126983, partial [Tanacetum coccineum]
EAFTRALTQYKEYLCEFWYTAKTLDDSKIWVSTPTVELEETYVSTPLEMLLGLITYLIQVEASDGSNHLVFRWEISGLDQISNKDTTILYSLANRVKVNYVKLIWEDKIQKLNKATREKVVPCPSVYNWALKPNQTKGPPFTDHVKAICNLDVHVDSKAPKPSSQTKEVPQGKKPRAKKTQSSLVKDKSPSHPSPPILVVGEMHKEAQQAAGGPTSLGATSKEGAYPQLSNGHDALADSTTKADHGLSATNDSIPTQQGMDEGTKNNYIDHIFVGTNPSVLVDQTKSARDGLKTAHTDSGINEESRADEISKKIKLEDLSDLLKDTRSALFTPNSPQDKPIIVLDESEEEETGKDEDTYTTSHNIPKDTTKDKLEQQKAKAREEVVSLKARPSYLDINQLTEILVTSLKPKLSKLLALRDFVSCLPTELKELPLKFTTLSGDIKELKQHVHDMEIELPRDLKEIPTKLETFTSTISSLTSQMLKRRKSSKIINFDVLTQKGPISLKVHREDKTSKAISNVKVTSLHLAECREVVQACPDSKEKGWKTIYGLIMTRMEYLDQTEKELKIDFNKPLKEQYPLNELNDLANNKRKRTGDSTNHSRSTKKHKSSVQHEEEKVYKAGKRLLYVKKNKPISLEKGASKVGIEVQQLSLKDCTTRSTETSDGLAAILTQLNNLMIEIKKVNKKVYAAQVGCELRKGPDYTKDCPLKEEGETLKEAYYTVFSAPYQPGGQYRAVGPGFYQ